MGQILPKRWLSRSLRLTQSQTFGDSRGWEQRFLGHELAGEPLISPVIKAL